MSSMRRGVAALAVVVCMATLASCAQASAPAGAVAETVDVGGQVEVPQITGMTLDEAGLTVDFAGGQLDHPTSVVTSQVPASGTTEVGSAVRLRVDSLLEVANAACDRVGKVHDDGATLVVDSGERRWDRSDAWVDGLECLVDELEMPTATSERLWSTTAHHGRVDESWGLFEASWSYNPTAGVNLVVEISPDA